MKDLNKTLRELEDKRTSYILELGELRYAEIRQSTIDKDRLESIIKNIVLVDQEIFKTREVIKNKIEEKEGLKCPECGEAISLDNKFCNSCGENLDYLSKENIQMMECKVCGNLTEERYEYCNVCGNKKHIGG